MNEEEKQAVENIKGLEILFEIDDNKDFEATPSVQKEIAKDLKILLNLIEKLQKENENFEKLNKDYSYSVDIVRENTRLRRQAFDLELENKKLKNTELKQAKIKYLEIEILNEELQEENEQLRTEVNSLKAENEELKILKSGIQTLQNLGIEDGKYIVMSKTDFLNGSCKHLLDNYISRQKIKDKIKEIDERIKNPEKISYWDSYTISECIGIRRILQELLEETEKIKKWR